MLLKLITLVFLFISLDSAYGRSTAYKQRVLDEALAVKFSEIAIHVEAIINNLKDMSMMVKSVTKGSSTMRDR